jgi:hypothetical protein
MHSAGAGHSHPCFSVLEELIHQARVGAILPMEKAGFFMLSSAAAKAFMWVISCIIRNCKASLLAASSQN